MSGRLVATQALPSTWALPSPPQGEQLLLFKALPVVKATGQWSASLPNMFNISFSFYYYLWFTILLYIPRESSITSTASEKKSFISCPFSLAVFPQLYGHMLRQRRKMLGGQPESTAKKHD